MKAFREGVRRERREVWISVGREGVKVGASAARTGVRIGARLCLRAELAGV
jgi:hypothetical protein